jgi:membrane-associated phospholipid phosphatase
MSRSEILATGALFAAFALVALLPWVMPLDELVFQWIQFHRTCRVEGAFRWVDPVVRGSLAALIACALLRDGWRDPWYIAGLVLLFVGGAAAVELLKTAVERLRPNAIAGMISGNSFPSGHTTGAAMAAAIAVLMVHRWDWPRMARWAAYGVATASVLLQGVGRLVHGSHWLSDVTASMLLGVAWVLGAGWMRRLPRAATGSLVAVACLAFFVFDDIPGARFRLPSAIEEGRASLASVEFGTPESRQALDGQWQDGPPEPIGPVAWARSPEVGVRLHADAQADGMLRVTVRPAGGYGGERVCARMSIVVNEWTAPEITLARGWREYHLEPPPGVLRAGENTIRFRLMSEPRAGEEEADVGLVAFRYLRLYPRA